MDGICRFLRTISGITCYLGGMRASLSCQVRRSGLLNACDVTARAYTDLSDKCVRVLGRKATLPADAGGGGEAEKGRRGEGEKGRKGEREKGRKGESGGRTGRKILRTSLAAYCLLPASRLAVEHKKTRGVRLRSATHNGVPVKPTDVRCRTSNACFRRSIFTLSGAAGSRFFVGPCAPASCCNFLLLLGYVLHFATSEGSSKSPLCICTIAVRGVANDARRAG